jgi:protein ImuB
MNVPSRRYLSLWLKRLSTDRLARRSSAQDDAPLVVVAPVKSALRVTAMNDAAERLGLITTMALADARAMYPALLATDADPEADAALLVAVADWCERYTPLVGLDVPDGILLDITGCAHLFGGEAALCRDLVGRLARQGLRARAAVADTVGCAWAVARYGRTPIVARGAALETLSPLPLGALRIDMATVAGLAQAGLKHIADVLNRPRAPLAARYGQGFIRRIDQALGREDESIRPRLPVPVAMAEQRFPEPIGHEEDVLGTIEHLAHELDRVLERRGEGARLMQAALFRADGKVHRLQLGTAAPLRDPVRIRKLFADRLAVLGDECDPGFGFDMLRLSAQVTERLDPQQTGLSGSGDDPADLAHLVDRLGARFGLRRVSRLEPRNTHIPEFAVAAVPAHTAQGKRSFIPAIEQDSLSPVRPTRLFQRPEPIEALAEVPDGPPVRFRWRRVTHEISHVEGPERIAMEWWRDKQGNALTRDYFRVEDKDGARMWLYREGLLGRDKIDKSNWYLHGLFA